MEDKRSHVVRGGSWVGNPWVCRSAFRNSDLAYRVVGYGFRVVSPQDS
ncbi:MAG: SUMF1/EgtB/PvdO family nonheme iron enzyme [Microcystaceae cyanobacterium]